eukprot:TRINITY_DN12994_c0_g1_i1.p1 TRINITY_DN12994_c0_g1~~TRINITY_DN12994_c0_g1_i1.p1  ORF type:complete len:127 (+),score=8.15 TRINITY_DN12994_c0_g1_i1:116-496(+)
MEDNMESTDLDINAQDIYTYSYIQKDKLGITGDDLSKLEMLAKRSRNSIAIKSSVQIASCFFIFYISTKYTQRLNRWRFLNTIPFALGAIPLVVFLGVSGHYYQDRLTSKAIQIVAPYSQGFRFSK